MAPDVLSEDEAPRLKQVSLTEAEVEALGRADIPVDEMKLFKEAHGISDNDDEILVSIEGRDVPVRMVMREDDFGTLERRKPLEAEPTDELLREEEVEELVETAFDVTGPADPSEVGEAEPAGEIEQAAVMAQAVSEGVPSDTTEAAESAKDIETNPELDRAISELTQRVNSFAEQRGYREGEEKSRFEKFQERFVSVLREIEGGYGKWRTSDEAMQEIRMLATELEADYIAAHQPFDAAHSTLLKAREGEPMPQGKQADQIATATDELVTALRNAGEDTRDMGKQAHWALSLIRDEILPRMERGIDVRDHLHHAAELLTKIGSESDHQLRRSTRRIDTALKDIASLKARR